jgi:hypothetical protein
MPLFGWFFFTQRLRREREWTGRIFFFFFLSSRSMQSLTPFFSSRTTHGKWKFREYEYLTWRWNTTLSIHNFIFCFFNHMQNTIC